MSHQPDIIMTAIKMFSALLLVLGIFMGSFYVLRRFTKRDMASADNKPIRIIDKSYIGVKKNVTLVEVSGLVLVLGVTQDRISLLTKIEDQVQIDLLKKTDSRQRPASFTGQLNRLLAKFQQVKTLKNTPDPLHESTHESSPLPS